MPMRAAQHVPVSGTRIKPNIERVPTFYVLLRVIANQFARIKRVPGTDAVLFNALCNGFKYSSVRGCSAPVSLWIKQAIGTPHCRCRDRVQSGRCAIIWAARPGPRAE